MAALQRGIRFENPATDGDFPDCNEAALKLL
jgi:hypothetical protein